jgi:GNAT superfamily N-acetyltransferase
MIPPGCKLRPALRSDLPDVFRLVRGLAEYERVLDNFTGTLADFDAMLFAPDHVAEATLVELPGRAPVGIALYYRTVNTFRGQIGMFLEDLFVEPDLRGQGIGHALLRHLAQMAIDRGYNMIQWSVLNWNEPSLKFYDRIGAVKVDDWQVRRLAGTAMTTLAGGMAKYG